MKRLLAALALVLLFGSGAAARDLSAATPYRTTEHFRFFGDADVHATLDRLAGVAEERLQRMCRPIAACDRLDRPIDIWVAEDADAFARGFPEPNPMSEWAAGVTFLREQRVILRAHGTAVLTLMETFDHELAHVLAHTYDHGLAHGSARSLPRWFHEGLAIWLAGESVLSRLQTALQAASSGQLLDYEELARGFPNQGKKVEIAYALSALFVKRMVHDAGPGAVVGLLHDAGAGVPFDAAFLQRVGVTPAEHFARLDDDLEASSSPFMFLSDGNFLWGLMTVLFIFVAWYKIRDRRRQMARLAASEDQRIAEEDMALLAERTRARLDRPGELDEDGKRLLN